MADSGTDRIRIRFAPGARKAVVMDAKIEAVKLLDDGTEVVTDISNFVRAADIRLHIGEAATAKLEVFVSEVEVETLVSEFKTLTVERSRWKRLRDIEVTGLKNPLGAKWYVRGTGIKAR